MTIVMPPPLSTASHLPRSLLLHHWDGTRCEASNDSGDLRFPALSGQLGILTRAGASSAADTNATSYAPVHSAPAWQITSGVPGLLLGSSPAEYLEWDALYLPQAMTVYVAGIERGTADATDGDVVLQLGSDAGARLRIQTDGDSYEVVYNNGSNTETSTVSAAPSAGELVELMVTLTSAGVVDLAQSIDSATATTGGAQTARTLPAAWGATKLRLNADQAPGQYGDFEFRSVKVAPGVLTLAQARVAF